MQTSNTMGEDLASTQLVSVLLIGRDFRSNAFLLYNRTHYSKI